MLPLPKDLPKWLFTKSYFSLTIVFSNYSGYNGKFFKNDLVFWECNSATYFSMQQHAALFSETQSVSLITTIHLAQAACWNGTIVPFVYTSIRFKPSENKTIKEDIWSWKTQFDVGKHTVRKPNIYEWLPVIKSHSPIINLVGDDSVSLLLIAVRSWKTRRLH